MLLDDAKLQVLSVLGYGRHALGHIFSLLDRAVASNVVGKLSPKG